jgi:sporulation protein YtfJ
MLKKNNNPIEETEVKEMQNQNSNKITDLIKESLGGIREFMDANTVTGTPIETPSGTVIIPISKISMGFAAGGNDYANKDSAPNHNNFGGGGGTGVSVTPIGFLVVDAEGCVDMININNPTNDLGSSIESIMEKLPGILDKIKDALSSAKKEEEKPAQVKAEETKEAKVEEAPAEAVAEAPKAEEEDSDAKAEAVLAEILNA